MSSSSNNGSDQRVLPQEMRERNRAVAEREAARLARPERRVVGKLAHATRSKSAVTSTPSGYNKTMQQQVDSEASREWCGPFSVARRMIEQREEARRVREAELAEGDNEVHHPLDEAMEAVELEKKRKAHPSLLWKSKLMTESSNENIYSKRQKRAQVRRELHKIPTLFQLCVDFLVENFEHVESLGMVDSSIRTAVAFELVSQSKLDGDAVQALAETGMDSLELVDCAQIPQDVMVQVLQKLLPAGLLYLKLDHSGRCFGTKVVDTILAFPESKLFALSIGGAYLLKDQDAANLVKAMSEHLSSISFKACPSLGLELCKSVETSYNVGGTLLELSFEDLNLTKEQLLSLASGDALRNLKSLVLRQMEKVDDEVVERLLYKVGDSLESIDLSDCFQLTDASLEPIRKCNNGNTLRALQLGGLKNLSEIGLETFFTHSIPNLPTPPMLRKLNLNGCAVTDGVMDLITKVSSMKRDCDGKVSSNLSAMGGLVDVNLASTSCSDDTMEHLAATSSGSLRELDVSFSPRISNRGLGFLVDKCGPQLSKVSIWGCAQISDEFLDGHARTDDASLEIEGSWMKNHGVANLAKQ